uniref:Uncharacterized protein n=1 Tax=Strigamia maritima TaxID=126957 RepID=T1IVV5_STRMM
NHGNDDTIIFDLTKPLSCGPDVNFTTYDHLTAMTIRHKVKIIDEHELSFKIRDSNKVELIELETQLKFDLQTRPNEAPVYNAAGSYFLAFGEPQKGINCFRKALTINPDNPDSLLNLGRIFYNLNYLDDALYLAQRSLDVQLTTENSAWFHYFSVGEILKAKGDFQRANMHFRISAKLNPDFEPALDHLSKIELITEANIHFYVLIFVVCFVVMIANFIYPYNDNVE